MSNKLGADYITTRRGQGHMFGALSMPSQGDAVPALQHFDPVFLSPTSGR